MTGWTEYPLTALADLVRVGTDPNAGPAPYIGLEHIEQEKLRLKGVGSSYDVTSTKYSFQSNDILFGKLRPYFRKVVQPQFAGICSTDIFVIGAKDIVSPKFLFYFLSDWRFVDFASGDDGGTHMPRADWKFLSQSIWKIPSQSEQKAIAAVLSSLDDKIDLLHRQNATLEAMAEALFSHLFLPSGEIQKLSPIVDWIYFNPKRLLAKGSVSPYLEMSHVNTTTFHPSIFVHKSFSSGMKFINGDTLIARITPCLENGKTCFVTFLNNNETGWGSTEYIVMRPISSLHPFFAYCLAKTDDFRAFAENCLTGSSGRQRVDSDHLKQYEIVAPTEQSVIRFNQLASSVVPKLHNNFNQIRTLEKLRDTLLPKLMSGEVRVEF